MATEDNRNSLMYGLDMAPPEPRLVLPTLVLAGRAIVRNTKVVEERDFSRT